MTEVSSPGGAGGAKTTREALNLVLRSLVELRETKGVTPHRVYRHIAARGSTRMTPGRLQLAMERAVRDGVLVEQQRGRYNLNVELPVPEQAWGGGGGGCGCGSSSSKPRRRRRKSCSKRRSGRRRRRSSSGKQCRRRRRKPLCGQVSLYKRIMRILFPRRRCGKHKKRQPYTWVRKHCRRNPNHHRYRKKSKR